MKAYQGETFFYGGIVMSDESKSIPPLKPPKTFEEQLEILNNHGLIIEDKEIALTILSKINYYRFSAYLLPFRNEKTKKYQESVTFTKIYRIYEFDRRLRALLQAIIEPIEILLKTRIAYYHGHKYGPEGYTDSTHFQNSTYHDKFLLEFRSAVNKNSKALFVKHHNRKYGGKFPIWAATELFSLGMLSKCYANMLMQDKKSIARDTFNTGHEQLETWMKCLADLRNRCAHYMRLYYYNFVVTPRFPNDCKHAISGRLFDIVYVLQYLYLNKTRWNNEFLIPLEALISEYKDVICLEFIGFPEAWLERLKESESK